jgi:hypothetical protein
MSLVGAVHGLFSLVWNRFIVSQFFLSFVFWFWIWVWFAVGVVYYESWFREWFVVSSRLRL